MEHPIYFWSQRMAARTGQAAARLRHRLCRLVNQEFGIAAKLSGDRAKMAAYLSGDPYIAFGKQCGKLPAGATKASHPDSGNS